MAEDGATDESISVIDSSQMLNEGSFGNGTGIPQFRISTLRAASVEDASHYALNLTCQSLQKRNRELEQQVSKLQKEKHKRKKSDRDSLPDSDRPQSEIDMSLSPSNSRSLQGRGLAADSSAVSSSAESSRVDMPVDEYIEFLQKQLGNEQLSRQGLASKLDSEKSKTHRLQQVISELKSELDITKDTVLKRNLDIDQVRRELLQLREANAHVQEQVMKQKFANSSVDDIRRKNRDLQSQVTRLEAENSSMQQLYEESAAKSEEYKQKILSLNEKCQHLTEAIKSRDKDKEKLQNSCKHLEEERKSLEQMNDFFQLQLDRERGDHKSMEVALPESERSAAAASRDELTEGSSALLENTTREIGYLQAQIFDMQSIIRTQTDLIRALGRKLRQRSSGSLNSSGGGESFGSGSSSPTNALEGPSGGKHVVGMILPRGPGRGSPEDQLESKPIACEEDLETMQNGLDNGPSTITNTSLTSPVPNMLDRPQRRPETQGFESPRPPRQAGLYVQLPTVGLVKNSDVVAKSGAHQGAPAGNPVLAPSFNVQTQVVFPGGSQTEPLIKRPAPFGDDRVAAPRNVATEPLIGDNRLSQVPMSASASNRHITIERNIEDPAYKPLAQSNQHQNINLREMTSSSPKVSSSATRPSEPLVLNNNPFVGNKPIPQRNIYHESDHLHHVHVDREENSVRVRPEGAPPRTCPVCNADYPMEMTQADFERHVHFCITSMEDAASRLPSQENVEVERSPSPEIMECPVCSSVFAPGTDQAFFQQHVEGHFRSEFEVLSKT